MLLLLLLVVASINAQDNDIPLHLSSKQTVQRNSSSKEEEIGWLVQALQKVQSELNEELFVEGANANQIKSQHEAFFLWQLQQAQAFCQQIKSSNHTTASELMAQAQSLLRQAHQALPSNVLLTKSHIQECLALLQSTSAAQKQNEAKSSSSSHTQAQEKPLAPIETLTLPQVCDLLIALEKEDQELED